MADGRAAGGSAEAAVRDQRHILVQAHARNGRGRAEHFRHSRRSARSFVADDHHISRFDTAVQNGTHGFFLAFEDAGAGFAPQHFRRHGALLDHGPLRREVAF